MTLPSLTSLYLSLKSHKLSLGGFLMLWRLREEGALSLSKLSKGNEITGAAGTCGVDQLEKLGFTQRVHDCEDRRQVLVSLTSRGEEVVEQVLGGPKAVLGHAGKK